MANKIFSIYKSGKERTTKNNDRLIVEISDTHVAGLVVGGGTNVIEDFELFELNAGSFKNFEENFAYAVIGSRLLDKPYADKKVFINAEHSMLIPAHLYSNDKSSDFLNVAFGENRVDEIFKDDLNNQFQAINSYRVPKQVREVVEKNLAIVTLEHTYTNILKNLFWILSALPANFIKVQFYKSTFIVVVFIEQRLQFIHTFSYTSHHDVLYHILNVCRQFDLKGAVVQVSGLIDLKSSLYEELSKCFKNISTDDLVIADLHIADYPPHYFTPFFKLAQ